MREPNTYGVKDDGFDGVTIKNGVVHDFVAGVFAFRADSVSVSNVLAVGNREFGIRISQSDSASVSNVLASGNIWAAVS